MRAEYMASLDSSKLTKITDGTSYHMAVYQRSLDKMVQQSRLLPHPHSRETAQSILVARYQLDMIREWGRLGEIDMLSRLVSLVPGGWRPLYRIQRSHWVLRGDDISLSLPGSVRVQHRHSRVHLINACKERHWSIGFTTSSSESYASCYCDIGSNGGHLLLDPFGDEDRQSITIRHQMNNMKPLKWGGDLWSQRRNRVL